MAGPLRTMFLKSTRAQASLLTVPQGLDIRE